MLGSGERNTTSGYMPNQDSEERNDNNINLELSLSTATFFLWDHSSLEPQRQLKDEVREYASPTDAKARDRTRRNPKLRVRREGKSEVVPPPFPWATNRRAEVYSLNRLLANNIRFIKGDVQCRRCNKLYAMEYDLPKEFRKIGLFVLENKLAMCDRAPAAWGNPTLPSCKLCGEANCVKPVISAKKRGINWLFLFLGTLLGCCTLEQLKYFCKHTKKHRTGAKDRVLYLAYMEMCRQLEPHGPF